MADNRFVTADDALAIAQAASETYSKSAFANVTIGEQTIEAGSTSGTLVLVAGTNVTLTPNVSTDSVTIESANSTYTPSDSNPSMDGTASAGVSDAYSRADHVHPTDTSRAAASHTHPASDITSGTIDAANLPVATSSAKGVVQVDGTTITASDGVISVASVTTHSTATATLAANGWTNDAQTVNVQGVTASNDVIVTPAPASHDEWGECGVRCTAQGSGTLTFSCTESPSTALTANVLVMG